MENKDKLTADAIVAIANAVQYLLINQKLESSDQAVEEARQLREVRGTVLSLLKDAKP